MEEGERKEHTKKGNRRHEQSTKEKEKKLNLSHFFPFDKTFRTKIITIPTV